MAFGGFQSGRNNAPMADINVIPLVDIMLVLLVIFIITAPLLTHSVVIDLPKASNTPNETRNIVVQFAINDAGQMYWDGEPVTRGEMVQRLAEAGARQPTPELHLRVDREARYAALADVMSEASKAGVTKVGFVTDPSGAVSTAAGPGSP
ncbi:biopolymer transporter ExbD [Emcibacter sp. SYSU 3D8]|uniref:ExbD/TolR family protein n=1 Tax=Emcibacter sp. SYSU 3D8 TaxID=3133969 RepID=UPI0031FE7A56